MIEKDELDVLLDQWRNTPEPDPQLKQRIWARIAAQDGANAASGWRLGKLLRPFAQPLGATAFVAICILLGIAVAELRLNRMQKDRTEAYAKNYMELIESQMPLEQEGNQP